MLCEKILGRLSDFDTTGKKVDYVDIEWHEAFTKIHRKQSHGGLDVGIRLGDEALSRGLYEGDVVYADDKLIVAVHTPPCEVVVAHVTTDHRVMIPKVCYEIGNRHAPLFYGDDDLTFITPYNEPMLTMLQHIHGVTAEKQVLQLNFDHKISSTVHGGHHH